MKKYVLLMNVLLLTAGISSCDNTTKTTESTIATTSSTLSPRSTDWMKADSLKKLNILFTNKISLKDGQKSDAGISFVLSDSNQYYVVTANHIVGPDGGFKALISPDQLQEKLSSWEINSLSSSEKSILSKVVALQKSGNDILCLVADTSITQKAFVLYKSQRNGSPSSGTLLVTDFLADQQEILSIPCMLVEEQGNTLFYAYKGEYMLDGNSGAPLVDVNGDVIGILRGGATGPENLAKAGMSFIAINRLQ